MGIQDTMLTKPVGLPPMSAVPQCNYSYSWVNHKVDRGAPPKAMQFGHALELDHLSQPPPGTHIPPQD